MLYCTECEQFFDEEDAITKMEKLGEFYNHYSACPYCGSEQIENAHRCLLCGEWMPDGIHDYCEECRNKALDMYTIMLLELETKNPGAERKDVLELMNAEFEHFWELKL